MVLTDQRGCGRSNGTLATNTPEILVQDLEAVREAVGADRCAPGDARERKPRTVSSEVRRCCTLANTTLHYTIGAPGTRRRKPVRWGIQ